jgi:predicted small secreted protein
MPAMTRTLALLALLGLVACETIQGAGRDLETAGEVIQDEAQEVQSDM